MPDALDAALGCPLQTNVWPGCYGQSWTGLMVPDAFTHPAKFARGLIQHIYAHAKAEGWLAPGNWIVDPFAGVSLGAHDALLAGYHVLHNELELKFHTLAQQNIALWQRRYGHLPGYGTAVLCQGDSRQLLTVFQPHIALCCSSPPYADGCTHTGGADPQPHYIQGGAVQHVAYGTHPANLGNLPPGQLDAALSSPPYGTIMNKPSNGIDWSRMANGERDRTKDAYFCVSHSSAIQPQAYGTTDGQLGQVHGETFWHAATTICAQVYAVLKPGGVAIWVTKNYVRDKREIDFTGEWARLQCALGFQWLHHHQALLVDDHGTQGGLFGQDTTHTTHHKNFFKKLHEKKYPHLAINYESVLCFRKPLRAG